MSPKIQTKISKIPPPHPPPQFWEICTVDYETKHEGNGYDFVICFSHVRDEPWGFSEYFLFYHRQRDSSDQLSLTVYVFVSLSELLWVYS